MWTYGQALAGYRSTIFAYGQTGSGKTHTMIGPSDDGAPGSAAVHHPYSTDAGIIPRSCAYILDRLAQNGVDFGLRASFLEIYKDQVWSMTSHHNQFKLPMNVAVLTGLRFAKSEFNLERSMGKQPRILRGWIALG